jgi:hypothetical protein
MAVSVASASQRERTGAVAGRLFRLSGQCANRDSFGTLLSALMGKPLNWRGFLWNKRMRPGPAKARA